MQEKYTGRSRSLREMERWMNTCVVSQTDRKSGDNTCVPGISEASSRNFQFFMELSFLFLYHLAWIVVAGFVCFILCTSNTLSHCPSSRSNSFSFQNHTQFPKWQSFPQGAAPTAAHMVEHKTQAWPIRISCLLASDWFRDGHVTELLPSTSLGNFILQRIGGDHLFLPDLLC